MYIQHYALTYLNICLYRHCGFQFLHRAFSEIINQISRKANFLNKNYVTMSILTISVSSRSLLRNTATEVSHSQCEGGCCFSCLEDIKIFSDHHLSKVLSIDWNPDYRNFEKLKPPTPPLCKMMCIT